jgi:N-acetylglucosaminyldiphosphoundecaprenol N-acetyl-beta-D-mannosaminyltransferase
MHNNMTVTKAVGDLQQALVAHATDSDSDTVRLLGVTIQPKSLDAMNLLVEEGISGNHKWIVSSHNLHSIYLYHRHPKLRAFYSLAHWAHIDGMPLVALGRLYGHRLRREQRVTFVDWIYPLMALAARRGWKVCYVGSSLTTCVRAIARLRQMYPSLQLQTSDGYFDERVGSHDTERLIQRINAYEPDLLIVGMGMPRQEFWTYDNYSRLKVRVVLSSAGAAFDYVAGTVPTPARWSGRLGLEWAFRLANDPTRLMARYLCEPCLLLFLLIIDRLRPQDAGFGVPHCPSLWSILWQRLWSEEEV